MFLYFDCKDKKKNNTLQIFQQVFVIITMKRFGLNDVVCRTPNDCSSNVKRLFVERQTIVLRTPNDGNTFESPCDYSENALRLQ